MNEEAFSYFLERFYEEPRMMAIPSEILIEHEQEIHDLIVRCCNDEYTDDDIIDEVIEYTQGVTNA